MGRQGYRNALELKRRRLFGEIARLKARAECAGGADRFRYAREIDLLERRYRTVHARLCELECEREGLWSRLTIGFLWIVDEMASAVEQWGERLDAKEASRRQPTRAHPSG
jgi:hypothetical protein